MKSHLEPKYLFFAEPAEDQIMEVCDKSILISKAMVTRLQSIRAVNIKSANFEASHKSALVSCCGKGMLALALETSQKRDCIKNELQSVCVSLCENGGGLTDYKKY
jgi:hypothetical protein